MKKLQGAFLKISTVDIKLKRQQYTRQTGAHSDIIRPRYLRPDDLRMSGYAKVERFTIIKFKYELLYTFDDQELIVCR